jgi:hypothetical protein
MKKLLGFILTVLILGACSSSNDVVNNGLFQKRKHRTGFHFNGLAHKGPQHSKEASRETFEVEKSIANEDYANHTEINVFDEQSEESEPIELVLERKREVKKALTFVQQELKGSRQEIKQPKESKFERTVNESNDDTDPLMTSAILSLVFAGLAILLIWFPIVNVVFSVLAVVFGRRAMKSEDENVQMMGRIGFIVGAIIGILSLLYTLFYIAYILLVFLVFGF